MSFKRKVQAKIADTKNIHDSILHGVTFDELITTVQANCGEKATEADVRREFDNIVSSNLKDAKHTLQSQMQWLLQQI